MITLDIPTFRTQFPEFAYTVKYPDALITFWATVAEKQVRKQAWGCQWPLGVSLYVAHEITIAAQSEQTASSGGTPGTFGGIANNKTVGSVSVGYDSASTSEPDAGWWNKTIYGQQFIRFARMFGAGGIQL